MRCLFRSFPAPEWLVSSCVLKRLRTLTLDGAYDAIVILEEVNRLS